MVTADREALDALLDRVFPIVEPEVQRSYALRGDDVAVDMRDDQRRAVDEFIDALVDDPTLEVRVVPDPETFPAPERTGDFPGWHLETPAENTLRTHCPDGGTCHHECKTGCWRVLNAGPLSDVYEGDVWPDDVYVGHARMGSEGHL